MAQPLFTRFIVDHVLLNPSTDSSDGLRSLNLLAMAFLGVVLLINLLGVIKDDRQRLLDMRVGLSLRRALIRRLFELPLARLADMKMGGILSRLSGDVDLTSGIVQKGVILPAVSLIRLLLVSAILLTLNARLAVITLMSLPGLVFVSVAMANRVRPIYRSIRRDAGEIDGRAGEAFTGIRVVRAFHRQAGESLEYLQGRHGVFRKELFAYRRELILRFLWGLLPGVANVMIIWYGGHLHAQGRATVGDILAFQWYVVLLIDPVLNIVESLSQLQRSQAATERVFEVLSMEPDKPDRPGAVDAPRTVHEICFEHVYFEYRQGRPIIRDFDITIGGGATVAIVGRSGAGKTTLTDLVGRFHDVTGGRITLNGRDIRDCRIRTYRDLFAIVQQHTFLFDGSVRENIAYGCPHAADVEIEDAARRANAHDFICQLPDRYATQIGEQGVTLSAGQRQRLSIARAFLKRPAILIMDEATSHLDSENDQLIHSAVAELMASRTTFVITHRLSTIQRADVIIVMDDGRIAEHGRHEQLMRERGKYWEMMARQGMPVDVFETTE
jgi:ATP-binding cassette subfamily B protein/subfamily B ATP-binding cassette protein MsbA